jgi:hypothetical protein
MSRRTRNKRKASQWLLEEPLRSALRKPRPDRPCVLLEQELGPALDAVLRGKQAPAGLSPATDAILERVDGRSPVLSLQAERMLDLACVLRTRGTKLLSMKSEENPHGHDDLHYPLLLWDLAACPWMRSPMTWRPRGKSRWSLFRSLARHVLSFWPIAPSLFSAFLLTQRDRVGVPAICVPLLVHIARGGSRSEAVDKGLTPGPITRKGWHAFLNSPIDLDFIQAFRRAQLIGLGKNGSEAERLIPHRLGSSLRRTDEGKLYELFSWLARHDLDELGDRDISRVLRLIENKQREEPAWSLDGRTPRSVLALWKSELSMLERPLLRRIAPNEPFPGPTKELTLAHSRTPWPESFPWTVHHIGSFGALRSEGRAMRHCVAWHADEVLEGRCSFWSLRHNDQRRLTLELNHRLGKIVQAKGKLNREPTVEEQAVLMRMAA